MAIGFSLPGALRRLAGRCTISIRFHPTSPGLPCDCGIRNIKDDNRYERDRKGVANHGEPMDAVNCWVKSSLSMSMSLRKTNWPRLHIDVVDVGCSCSEQLHCNFVPNKSRQRIESPLSRIAEKRIFRHWYTKALSSTGWIFSSVECVGMRLVPWSFVTTKSVFITSAILSRMA